MRFVLYKEMDTQDTVDHKEELAIALREIDIAYQEFLDTFRAIEQDVHAAESVTHTDNL